MDKVDKKVKTYGVILGIVLFVLLIAGFTYANLTWKSKSIVISGKSNCLEVESVKGSDITGGNLLLQDENFIIDKNKITIKNGMVITNVTAKIKSTCSISGYMTLNLNVTNLSSAFTSSGNSTGALKYVLASYDPSTYSTISTTALNGKSFDIAKTGSITSTGTIKLKDEVLTNDEIKAYLVIFYIDGNLASNDIGSDSTNFKTNLEAVVTQNTVSTEVKEKTNVAQFITNLYNNNVKTTIVNNSITYNQVSSVGLMNDRFGSMSTGIDEGNIRYYGTNPNNYIYFNCSDYSNQSSSTCETWRIIGVFDGKVKIMRNENIGNYSWDTSASDVNDGKGVGEWSQADLMKLLNDGYESETVGGSLYWNAKSGTCYESSNNTTKACDFSNTGLKNDITRNLISEEIYYTRGHTTNKVYVDEMYDKERVSGTVYAGGTTSWTGKVALPYPSDYGYAANLKLCQNSLYYYDEVACSGDNWMKFIFGTGTNKSPGWLLNSAATVDTSSYVNSTGNFASYYVYYHLFVVPTLYLLDSLDIVAGNGMVSSPYQLSV